MTTAAFFWQRVSSAATGINGNRRGLHIRHAVIAQRAMPMIRAGGWSRISGERGHWNCSAQQAK